jgi:hypothetical protein
MMCLEDIIAGGERPNSWRLHLEGAATMINGKLDRGAFMDPDFYFLQHWFLSLKNVALIVVGPVLTVAPVLLCA